MPRVPGTPQYGSSQQIADAPAQIVPQRSSVNPALLSTASTGLATFGGDLSQAGGTMARVAIDMQTRNNVDEVFAATAAARDEYQKFEQQTTQRMGRDAYGALEDTQKWWDESTPKFSEKLTNPEARRMFERELQPLRTASASAIGRHESIQRRASVVASADADMDSATNAAAAHPNDPLVQQNARDTIDRNIGVVAQLNGFTEKQVKAARETQYTRLHLGVIQSQVDTHPDAAREYYQAHIDEIAGTEHAKIEKMLEIGGLKTRTQEIAGQAMALGKNETDTLAWVSENYSGEEEDMAKTRVSQEFAQRDQELQRQHRDASDAAWQAYDQGGIGAVSSVTAAAMDPQAWVQMQEYARNRAKQNESDVVTNTEKYREMLTMAAKEPARFAQQDPNTWRPWASTQDLGVLKREWEQTLTNQGKAPPNIFTPNRIAENMVSQRGLSGEENKPRAAGVYKELMDAMAAAQERFPDKKLSDAELQAAADEAWKGMMLRKDKRLEPVAKGPTDTEISRLVSQNAATINRKNGEELKGRELTDYRVQFQKIADEALVDQRRKVGGTLSKQAADRVLAKLLRYGKVKSSATWKDWNGEQGYYFEFAHIDGIDDKFEVDKP